MTSPTQPHVEGIDRGQLEAQLAQLEQDLADLYRCATELLDATRRDRAVLVMISHAVREIANNLAHHLGRAEGVELPASVNTTRPVRDLASV